MSLLGILKRSTDSGLREATHSDREWLRDAGHRTPDAGREGKA
jgi:hypothetical protein